MLREFGFLEPYDSNTRGISFDTSKTYHFAGQAYAQRWLQWQFPVYNDVIQESGGKFALPSTNASGGTLATLLPPNPPVAGQLTDASLFLIPLVNPDGTTVVPNSSGCTPPVYGCAGYASPVQVVLQQERGRFDGGVTRRQWEVSRPLCETTLGHEQVCDAQSWAALEQQRLIGNLAEKLFNEMWSLASVSLSIRRAIARTRSMQITGRYASFCRLTQRSATPARRTTS